MTKVTGVRAVQGRVGRNLQPHRKAKPVHRARRVARFVRRNAIWIAAFIAAAHFLLTLVTFLPQPHTGGDNAAYISLARSLLERHTYASIWDPAAPPHTQYPPVFPAILAVGMILGLESFTTLKIIISFMSAVAVAATFLWLMKRRRPVMALCVASLLAVSPGVLELAHWVLSDVPFWCFTMIAVWGFERLRPHQRIPFAIAVLATVLAYFTRSAGLPLLVAVTGFLALRRRWRHLAIFAAAVVPLAVLWWLRARAQGGVDYVSQFWFVNPYAPELGRIGIPDLFDRAGENAMKYLRIHMPTLLTGRPTALAILASFILFALAIFGWARRLRRPALTELFVPLYLGLLLVWPSVWSGERFLLPALPLILFYAGDALVRLTQWINRAVVVPVCAAALGLLALLMVPAQLEAARLSARCMVDFRTGDRYACLPTAWRDWFAVAEWAKTALPEDAVVISRKPTLFYVIANRPSLYYPMSPEPAELISAAQASGARYIVFDHLDGLSQMYLFPAVAGRISAFCLMHSSPIDDTAVLGILPEAASIPDRPADVEASLPECPPGYWSAEARRALESR